MTINKHKTNLSRFTTLEGLLAEYSTPCQLAQDIDMAMLYLVLYLHYDAEHVKKMIPIYETLHELRNLILNHIKPVNQ